MRKIFTFLCAALLSVSMSAEMVEFNVGQSALNLETINPTTIQVYGSFMPGAYSLPILGIKYWNIDDVDANTAPTATADDTFNFSYMDGTTKKVLADKDGNECSFKFSDMWVDTEYGVKKVAIFTYEKGWDPANYKWIDAPVYYVVGSMNEWTANEAYKLAENPAQGAEYMATFTFAANDAIKVVKGAANKDDYKWYPGGTGNDYVITEAGEYTVYFRPAGKSEWGTTFYFTAIKKSGTGIENTTATEKATKAIRNGQLVIEKNGKFYNATGAEVK